MKKSTPPPHTSSPPPHTEEDLINLTPSERLEILELLKRTSPHTPSPNRLAVKIEERLSDLVWDLMHPQGKASRFSERYSAQRERLRETLLDERGKPSEYYDKALHNLHALLDTLNDPDDLVWGRAFPHPLT